LAAEEAESKSAPLNQELNSSETKKMDLNASIPATKPSCNHNDASKKP